MAMDAGGMATKGSVTGSAKYFNKIQGRGMDMMFGKKWYHKAAYLGGPAAAGLIGASVMSSNDGY
jgi:hypothetical protein